MTKTLNRIPQSVKQLSYSDLGIKYFNYESWKGLNEDKNYVGVDQSTFADCNNVMVDGAGVLRSRPALKILIDDELVNVVDVWTFDVITAYKVYRSGKYKLVFLKNGRLCKPIDVPNKFQLVFADEKIFMFAKNRIAYLDISSWKVRRTPDKVVHVTVDWYDSEDTDTAKAKKAIDTIYVPNTSALVEGVVTDAESPNEFTSAQSTVFAYDSIQDIDDLLFTGKEVTIKIDETTYTFTYDSLTKYVLVNKLFETSSDVIRQNNIKCKYTDEGNKLVAIYVNNSRFYCSFDLRTFSYIGEHAYFGDYVISDDCTFVAIAYSNNSKVEILAKSLLATEEGGAERFPVWTKIINTDIDYHSSAEIHMRFHDADRGVVSYYGERYTDASGNTKFGTMKFIYKVSSDTEKVYYIGNPISLLPDVEAITGEDDPLVGPNIISRLLSSGLSSLETFTSTWSDSQNEWVYTFTLKNGFVSSNSGVLEVTNLNVGYILKYKDSLIESGTITVDRATGSTLNISVSETIAIDVGNYAGRWITTPQVTWKLTIDKDAQTFHVDFKSTEGRYGVPINVSTSFNGQYEVLTIVDFISTYVVLRQDYSTHDKYMCEITSSAMNQYQQTSQDLPANLSSSQIQSDVNIFILSDKQILNFDYDIVMHQLNKVSEINDVESGTPFVVYQGDVTNVLTSTTLYRNGTPIKLLSDESIYPLIVTSDSFAYLVKTDDVTMIYGNTGFTSGIFISVLLEGTLTIPEIDEYTELNNYYFASGNKLYVNDTGAQLEPDEFKWYFPKRNTQLFDYQITGLHPISTEAVAIFFEHGIWYTTWTDGKPYYFKSRIPLGVKQGDDIITTYDGRYTIFSTERGLVSMSYQDFISSTEQALDFLSDTIHDVYKEWNNGAVKIIAYQFWLILYHPDSLSGFIFDLRNNSWWPVSVDFSENQEAAMSKFYILDNELLLIHNYKQYCIDKEPDDYVDIESYNSLGDILTKPINWMILSQKIHFAEYYYRGDRLINYDTLQYFKKVQGMRFDALSDTNEEVSFIVKCITYDKSLRVQNSQSVKYEIDFVSSILKKMNYTKLQEFQFILVPTDLHTQYPLMLTNIAIKYSIIGLVK